MLSVALMQVLDAYTYRPIFEIVPETTAQSRSGRKPLGSNSEGTNSARLFTPACLRT